MNFVPRFFLSFTLGSFLLATGCAHYPDVRPKESGIHSVILSTESKGDGYQEANAQANSFCKDRFKQSAFQVSESSEYTGSMDESAYNAAKTAAKIFAGVGAGAAVFGGKTESKVGLGGAVGGGVADSVLGNGYVYTLEFKCQ